MASTSSLRALAELILKNVNIVEADNAKRGVSSPSLDEPYVIGSEDFLNDATNVEVQRAKTVIDVAAQQLIQTVRNPHTNMIMMAYGVRSPFFKIMYVSVPFFTDDFCLVEYYHVGHPVCRGIQLLGNPARSGPQSKCLLRILFSNKLTIPQGLHVNEISLKCGADPMKIGE